MIRFLDNYQGFYCTAIKFIMAQKISTLVMTARHHKEIKLAKENTSFEFRFDEAGEINNAGFFYIIFAGEGAYRGIPIVLMGKFCTSDGTTRRFPREAPLMYFMTPIWHVNVSAVPCSEDNVYTICLDTLREEWAPALGLEAVVNTIRLLLMEPCDDSPFNKDAVGQNPRELRRSIRAHYLPHAEYVETLVARIKALP